MKLKLLLHVVWYLLAGISILCDPSGSDTHIVYLTKYVENQNRWLFNICHFRIFDLKQKLPEFSLLYWNILKSSNLDIVRPVVWSVQIYYLSKLSNIHPSKWTILNRIKMNRNSIWTDFQVYRHSTCTYIRVRLRDSPKCS